MEPIIRLAGLLWTVQTASTGYAEGENVKWMKLLALADGVQGKAKARQKKRENYYHFHSARRRTSSAFVTHQNLI